MSTDAWFKEAVLMTLHFETFGTLKMDVDNQEELIAKLTRDTPTVRKWLHKSTITVGQVRKFFTFLGLQYQPDMKKPALLEILDGLLESADFDSDDDDDGGSDDGDDDGSDDNEDNTPLIERAFKVQKTSSAEDKEAAIPAAAAKTSSAEDNKDAIRKKLEGPPKISQTAAAAAMGVNPAQLSQYLNGKATTNMADKVSKAADTWLDESDQTAIAPPPGPETTPKPTIKPDPKPTTKPDPKPTTKPDPKPTTKPNPTSPKPGPKPPPNQIASPGKDQRLTNRWGVGLDMAASGARDFFPSGWVPTRDVSGAISVFGHDKKAIDELVTKGKELQKEQKQFDVDIDHEYAATIFAYTQETKDHLYTKLNKACRTATISEEKKLDVYRDYLYHIQEAMSTLTNYQGWVYRGINMKLAPDVYAEGKSITWTQLSSASKSQHVAAKFLGNSTGSGALSGTYFKIYTKTGKEISDYSEFPDEEEVLLTFNKYFTVKEKLTKPKQKKKALPDLAGYDLKGLDVYVLQQK